MLCVPSLSKAASCYPHHLFALARASQWDAVRDKLGEPTLRHDKVYGQSGGGGDFPEEAGQGVQEG